MGDRLMCCETSAHASDCPNNPNSLGFDEPGLWMVDEWIAEAVVGAMHKPSDADLFAAVRRGVESGTIGGAYVWDTDDWTQQEQYKFDEGKWLVIPIRGSET